MNTIACPICHQPLQVRLASSRKAKRKKTFIMMVCPQDGRHARLFINDQQYVQQVLERLEGPSQVAGGGDDAGQGPAPSRRSKTELERGGAP